MKVILFGDSLVGDPGEPGGLAKAFERVFAGQDFSSFGVSGSTVGNWLASAGLSGKLGRWGDRSRKRLSDEQKGIYSLHNLAKRKADLYIISLGTNDANNSVTPAKFAEEAQTLVLELPKSAQIIWIEANQTTKTPSLQRKKQRLFEALFKKVGKDKRVLVIRPDGKGAYPSGKIHPPRKEHERFLMSNLPRIHEHMAKGPTRKLHGFLKVGLVLFSIVSGVALLALPNEGAPT